MLRLFKNMSAYAQGVVACLLGLILVLGTLGKLGILQGILDSIMMFVGFVLIVWGIHTGSIYQRLQIFFHKKRQK